MKIPFPNTFFLLNRLICDFDVRRRITITAALLFAAISGVHAGENALMLVEKGVSKMPIIVFKDAPPRTRSAADDLATYIEKISGVRPQIIDGEPKTMPAHAIWIGYQPALKDIFPKVDFDFKYQEEIFIAANGNHLVIAGRDRWNKQHMTQSYPHLQSKTITTVENIQQEYGTANAIYTFIQQYLNVRWLWPGEIGEDVIKSDTISFTPFEYHYHPQFLVRAGIFRQSALDARNAPSGDWTRFQRLQLDSFQTEIGHGFGTWWEKYHKTHPEYFALQPDGTRSGFPYPNAAKLCVSTPAVWDQWVENLKSDLKENPNKTNFNAAPNDSYTSGHCVCENCRAWDDPNGEKMMFNWEGHKEEGVSLSDRHVTFWNHLVTKMKQQFPNRNNLHVMGLAYGNWRNPPVSAVPDKNIIMYGCFTYPLFKDTAATKRSRWQFEGWGKLSPIIWRPNLWQQAGKMGFPEMSLTMTMENFRFAAEHNGIGFLIDTTWENWATQAPAYYLMAQLGWNPWLDGQAILDDYYKRGFGPAAGEIAEYWKELENAWAEVAQRYTGEDGKVAFFDHLGAASKEIYTPEFFNKLDQLLNQATAKLASQPVVYRKRVEFVRSGFTFTQLMIENLALMERVVKSKGKDTEAQAQAETAWKKIVQLMNENPHAFNANGVRAGLLEKKLFKGADKSDYFPYLLKNKGDNDKPKAGKEKKTDKFNDLDR